MVPTEAEGYRRSLRKEGLNGAADELGLCSQRADPRTANKSCLACPRFPWTRGSRVPCYCPRDENRAAGTEILDPRGGTEELGVSARREEVAILEILELLSFLWSGFLD